mgnify:CR=1 FL=1
MMEDADADLLSSMSPSMFPRFQKNKSSDDEKSDDQNGPKFPDTLPILPLRGVVVYPNTAVPLTVGQPRSVRLVDEVTSGETKLVGLVAARDPEAIAWYMEHGIPGGGDIKMAPVPSVVDLCVTAAGAKVLRHELGGRVGKGRRGAGSAPAIARQPRDDLLHRHAHVWLLGK